MMQFGYRLRNECDLNFSQYMIYEYKTIAMRK